MKIPSSIGSSHHRDNLCLGLLLLIPLIAAWPITSGWLTVNPLPWSGVILSRTGPLPGLTALDPNIGLTMQALGRLAARQWLSGQVPWWNPNSGVGLPLSAEGQNPALFLPFVLLLSLHNGVFLLKLALEEVAGVSTFLLLRRMGLTRTASVTGGALFAVNGTFAWFGHGPMMPIAFLPLLLLGIENASRIARAPGTVAAWSGWPLAAVAIALSLYAAFPETAYLDLLLGFLWALVRLSECPRWARAGLFRHLALAAIVGLLLSTPFILPFGVLLGRGDVGMHGSDIVNLHTPLAGLPLLIMPTLFGPLGVIVRGAPSLPASWLWSFVGGYVTLPILCCALLALGGQRFGHRALRWVLACWCVAIIGASFGVPILSSLVYAVPLLGHTQVFRYSPPSWEFAFSILAAFAVDDRQRATGRSGYTVPIVAVAGLLLIVIACLLARPVFPFLRDSFPSYAQWFVRSVVAAVAVTGVILALLQLSPRQLGVSLAAAILVGQSMVLYGMPLLSGAREERPVTDGITFLRQHLGLDRFYTLGPIRPNYPAYFGIASINSDYLPAPHLWAHYIATALDPASDPLAFSGQSQIPGVPIPDHAAMLRANIAAYRELGVRYVVAPPGTEALDDVRLNPVIQPVLTATSLASGQSFDTVVGPAELRPGALRAVTVVLGTFAGSSHGLLSVRVCVGDACETGMGDLATAADNRPFELALNRALSVPAGARLRLRFAKLGPTPVAIWLYRDQLTRQVVPGLGLIYADGGVPHRRVYQDAVMEIDAIDGTAPYMETAGSTCDLRDLGRNVVTAHCAGPAMLIRRVLAYPGWEARVNGRLVPVSAFPPIFQAIPLPKGSSRVQFRYTPPFAPAIEGACLLGVLLLLWGCFGPIKRWTVYYRLLTGRSRDCQTM